MGAHGMVADEKKETIMAEEVQSENTKEATLNGDTEDVMPAKKAPLTEEVESEPLPKENGNVLDEKEGDEVTNTEELVESNPASDEKPSSEESEEPEQMETENIVDSTADSSATENIETVVENDNVASEDKVDAEKEEPSSEDKTDADKTDADCIVIDDNEEDTKSEADKKDKKVSKSEKDDSSLGSTVAKHYNALPEGTKETRKESRIFHLRNFNNWTKSVLINEYLEKIKRRKRTSDDIVVLDMACGKGGDLLKWQKGKVDHVIMADIAETSVEQCKERYAQMERNSRHNRHRDRIFGMEAYAADCTKDRLCEKFKKKDVKIDLTSCQFAFHYSFESYAQAEMMLKNACERLRVGGYFIGTTPDAYELVKRIKTSDDGSFGNGVYKITAEDKENFPLFGSKYMFHLEGVVDCPEFLVHFPTLEKLAEKHDMKLVAKKNFHDFYKSFERDYSSLLNRMNALEEYPAPSGKTLIAEDEDQYSHAKERIESKGTKRVGTLSKEEWEAVGLYSTFVFEKIDTRRGREDKSRDRRSERDSKSDKDSDRKRHRDKSRDSRRDRSRDGRDSKRRSDSSASKRSRKEEPEVMEFEVKDAIECDDDEPEVITIPDGEAKPADSAEESTEDKVDDSSAKDTAQSSEAEAKEQSPEQTSTEADADTKEESPSQSSAADVEMAEAPAAEPEEVESSAGSQQQEEPESTTTEESNEAEAAPSSESIVEEKGQEEVSAESNEVEVAEEATEETLDDSTPQADEGSQDAPAE